MSNRGTDCSSSDVGASSSGSQVLGLVNKRWLCLRLRIAFGRGGEVVTSAASFAGKGVFLSRTGVTRLWGILEVCCGICGICDLGIRCLRFRIGAMLVMSINFGRPRERIGTAIAVSVFGSALERSTEGSNFADGLCLNSSS